MKHCTITEYEDETIVEYYNQKTKERTEFKFDDFDTAIKAIRHLDLK